MELVLPITSATSNVFPTYKHGNNRHKFRMQAVLVLLGDVLNMAKDMGQTM